MNCCCSSISNRAVRGKKENIQCGKHSLRSSFIKVYLWRHRNMPCLLRLVWWRWSLSHQVHMCCSSWSGVKYPATLFWCRSDQYLAWAAKIFVISTVENCLKHCPETSWVSWFRLHVIAATMEFFHNDIKPGNVLINTETLRVKLSWDFWLFFFFFFVKLLCDNDHC